MNSQVPTKEYETLIKALGVTPRGPVSLIGGGQPNLRQVLDLASGKGNIACGLARTQTDVIATDINNDCLEYINDYSGNLRIETMMISGVELDEFGDCSFNAVTIAQAIYLETDWAVWLKNIDRIMLPGGRLGHRWSLGKPGDFAYDMLLEIVALTKGVNGSPEEYYRGTMLKSEVSEALSKLGMVFISKVEAEPSQNWTVRQFIDRMVEGTGVSWLSQLSSESRANVARILEDWAIKRTGSLEETIRLYEDNSWDIWEKPAV